MKALVISDIHGAELKYETLVQETSPDVIIIPGDIPSSIDMPSLLISLFQFGKRNQYIKNFYHRFLHRANLRQIRSAKIILSKLNEFNIPVVFIHGNTETEQTRSWMKLFAIRNPNLYYISDGYKVIENTLFVGHGWVPSSVEFNRDMSPGEIDQQMAQTILLDTLGRASQHADRSILVSHTPPYGTKLDFLPHVAYHAGSKPVRKILESKFFDGVISGHLHESPAAISTGKWWGVNAGAAVEDKAIFLDLDRLQLQWIKKIIRKPGLETMIYQRRRQIQYDKTN